MRGRFVILVLVAMILALALPALAQAQTRNGEYANVSSVEAFSAQANFMSLPGYLRWVTWKDQGVWLTYAEAERIVAAQKGG